jgi:peptide/nickel transport system substrate-binding protein
LGPNLQTQRRSGHPAIGSLRRDLAGGRISRREFLTRATALGIGVTGARLLAGAHPAQAQQAAMPGGTLRVQMQVMEQRDPRLWDFVEMANSAGGQLERLIGVNRDGALHGILLDSWEVDETASTYILKLRPGVTWTDGTAFTAEDVAANFEGWCDRSVAGNSMASRLSSLIDPTTGRAASGAVQVIDALTVKLSPLTPDVTLLPGISDYPAAVQRQDLIGTDPLTHGIGTGAYRTVEYTPGVRAVIERNAEHRYWRSATLDRIEFIDLGPDPSRWFEAARDGQIDMVYDSAGEFVAIFDTLGWTRSEVATSSTVVIRGNQQAVVAGLRPYSDLRIRQALALAVSNEVLLELGYAGLGTVAENTHVSPLHPEYVPLPPISQNLPEARRLLQQAGFQAFEHELVSIDDDWQRPTADACAAQLRDAGFAVRRTILPGPEFWAGWLTFPFSVTNWNGRELGVQVLALAYRSGEAWNETGFANAEFDALLDESLGIFDAEARRDNMRRMEEIMQSEGVIIQPYWRTLFRHARPDVVNAERHQKDLLDIHGLGFAAHAE